MRYICTKYIIVLNHIYEDGGKAKTIYASYIYCTELYID